MSPLSKLRQCLHSSTSVLRCIALLALVLSPWFSSVEAYAQASREPLAVRRIQAGFLYNFIRFTTWPKESLPDDVPIQVGLLGDSHSVEILRRELEGKSYGGHAIKTTLLEKESSLAGLHIVFLLNRAPLTPAELCEKLANQATLSLGEAEGFTKAGGMIRLFIRGDTMHFSLNPQAAREAGILLSSQLASLADTDTP